MTQLDQAYRAQRKRLTLLVAAAAARMWVAGHRDAERAVITDIVGLVEAGQAHAVALMDAYMSQKVGVPVKGVDSGLYNVGTLRGIPADKVYGRPWGALGGQLQEGATYEAAMSSAQASLQKLVATDMQMTQVASSRDWMMSEPTVTGYSRAASPGACGYCQDAADGQVFAREDLMPIHEGCSCGVEPVTGDAPTTADLNPDGPIVNDPEIGPRLLAEDWAE